MNNSFKKNEIAKVLGLKKSTIRYYEEVGLISPLIDANDYRKYRMKELKLLSQINFLRAINLDIRTIKQVIYDDSFDSNEVLLHKKKELNDLIREYRTNINQIDEILHFQGLNRSSQDYHIVEFAKRCLYKIKPDSNEQEIFYKENKEFFQSKSLSIGHWFIKTVDIKGFLNNDLIKFDEYIEVREGKGSNYIFIPKGKYICFDLNFDGDEPVKWEFLICNFKKIIEDESYIIRDGDVLFINKDNLNLSLSDRSRTISVHIPIK